MEVKILQRDIFGVAAQDGVGHGAVQTQQAAAPTRAPAKKFPSINIDSGISSAQAAGDAMLIHRSLQKKLMWSELKTARQFRTFMGIVQNEMAIKAGLVEPVTATRDSILLLTFLNMNPGKAKT
ncbi:MAG: hypothetical protein LBJ69_00770 [Holosporales bacterium]|nr:hypothetical protein [Holosporales bacterium]